MKCPGLRITAVVFVLLIGAIDAVSQTERDAGQAISELHSQILQLLDQVQYSERALDGESVESIAPELLNSIRSLIGDRAIYFALQSPDPEVRIRAIIAATVVLDTPDFGLETGLQVLVDTEGLLQVRIHNETMSIVEMMSRINLYQYLFVFGDSMEITARKQIKKILDSPSLMEDLHSSEDHALALQFLLRSLIPYMRQSSQPLPPVARRILGGIFVEGTLSRMTESLRNLSAWNEPKMLSFEIQLAALYHYIATQAGLNREKKADLERQRRVFTNPWFEHKRLVRLVEHLIRYPNDLYGHGVLNSQTVEGFLRTLHADKAAGATLGAAVEEKLMQLHDLLPTDSALGDTLVNLLDTTNQIFLEAQHSTVDDADSPYAKRYAEHRDNIPWYHRELNAQWKLIKQKRSRPDPQLLEDRYQLLERVVTLLIVLHPRLHVDLESVITMNVDYPTVEKKRLKLQEIRTKLLIVLALEGLYEPHSSYWSHCVRRLEKLYGRTTLQTSLQVVSQMLDAANPPTKRSIVSFRKRNTDMNLFLAQNHQPSNVPDFFTGRLYHLSQTEAEADALDSFYVTKGTQHFLRGLLEQRDGPMSPDFLTTIIHALDFSEQQVIEAMQRLYPKGNPHLPEGIQHFVERGRWPLITNFQQFTQRSAGGQHRPPPARR